MVELFIVIALVAGVVSIGSWLDFVIDYYLEGKKK